MLFKRFLIWSSGLPPVQWCGTIYAFLKEDIIGNIHVKNLKFESVVQEEVSFKEKVCASTRENHLQGFKPGKSQSSMLSYSD